MLLYDNLEDTKTKLIGTYCYYAGKAVMVKDVQMDVDMDSGKEIYLLALMSASARSVNLVKLDDPLLNYMTFNLGYSNHQHSAVWWYRIPMKQYRQGLKHDQVGRYASRDEFMHNCSFQFGRPIADMMENNYPKFSVAEEMLKKRTSNIVAFNKDFACTWDDIHDDLIVEYKSNRIGCMLNLNNFKLLNEYKHLTEALKEAVA